MLTTLPPASLRVQCPLNLPQILFFSLLSFFLGSFFLMINRNKDVHMIDLTKDRDTCCVVVCVS